MREMKEGRLYMCTATLYHVASPVHQATYSFLYRDSIFLCLGEVLSLTKEGPDPYTSLWKTECWHYWKILLEEKPVWLLCNGEEGRKFLLDHVIEVTHNDLDASRKAL